MEKWEYWTTIYYAHIDNPGVKEYLAKALPDWKKPTKCAIQTLVPALDDMGNKGWELVSLQPVAVAKDDSIILHTQGYHETNRYLAVWKRRIAE